MAVGVESGVALTPPPLSQGLGEGLAEFGYVLDANGNRVQLDVTGSEVPNGTEEYTYDALDRLVEVDYGTGTAVYTYDANGNRTSVVSGGVTTNYVVDAAHQLQELRDGSNQLLVDLDDDANGNRTAANGDSFAYDWANRLTEATVGSTTVDVAYLADGSRAEKDDGTTTTPYLYDRAGGLARVVDDGTGGFVHGPAGLIEEVGSTATTWTLADGLGSVRTRAATADPIR